MGYLKIRHIQFLGLFKKSRTHFQFRGIWRPKNLSWQSQTDTQLLEVRIYFADSIHISTLQPGNTSQNHQVLSLKDIPFN